MKLPHNIEGVYREGRTDSFISNAIEPLWFGSTWEKVKGTAKKIGNIAWDNKCLSCFAISNPIAALACQQACKRI